MVGHLISEIPWNLPSGVRDLPPVDKSAAMADLLPNCFIWTLFCPDLDQAMPSRTCPVVHETVRHLTSSRGLRAEAIVFVALGSLSIKANRNAWELLVLQPLHS